MPKFSKSKDIFKIKTGFRSISLVFSAFGLVAFGFFVIFWLVNINEALYRIEFIKIAIHWRDIFPQTAFYDFFRGLCKDYSSITPFLGMWFFFRVFRGFFKIAKQSIPTSNWYNFPFPVDYKVTWVQLGLLGTLWAFVVVIGFQLKPGGETQESINLMIMAFGTALLSSFTAVFLAFVCAPIVIKFFRSFIEFSVVDPEKLPWIEETPDVLSRVKSKLFDFRRGLEIATDEVNCITGVLKKMNQEISRINPQSLHNVPDHIESMRKNIGTFINKQKEFQENIFYGLTATSKTIAESMSKSMSNAVSMILNQFSVQHQQTKEQFGIIARELQNNLKEQKNTQAVFKNEISTSIGELKNGITKELQKNRKEQKNTQDIFKNEIRTSIDSYGEIVANAKEEMVRFQDLQEQKVKTINKDIIKLKKLTSKHTKLEDSQPGIITRLLKKLL